MFLPNIELLAGVVSSSLKTWEQASPLGTEEQEERRLRGETATALNRLGMKTSKEHQVSGRSPKMLTGMVPCRDGEVQQDDQSNFSLTSFDSI